MLQTTVKRVLLVDDSKMVLSVHETFLRAAGFECLTAAGGAEALECLMRNKFDLLVTDLNMPKMDGYELAKRAKEMNPNLPVMMISTESEKTDIDRGLQSGVDVYMTKPVDPEDFVLRCRMVAG